MLDTKFEPKLLLDELNFSRRLEDVSQATYVVKVVEVCKKSVKLEMPFGSYHEAEVEAEAYRQNKSGELMLTDSNVEDIEVNVSEIIYQDKEL